MTADGGVLRLDGRYRLISRIGAGGMSVVWHALDEVLERHVAVKVLAASLGDVSAFPRRLLTEARAVAALSHPHITSVHDFGVHQADDGQRIPYLVMELLDGELLSITLRRGSLPWRQAVTICAQLTSALQAAHDHGTVHRDVKPANVMLTRTGVKVLDFGISTLIGEIQTADSADLFGTAAYLAPERRIGGQITAAADVYAAGLVLYRCLTGRLPWPASSVIEMLYAHAYLPPHPLSLLGLPRAIEEICMQCLSREPEHRPQAGELTQILSREVHRNESGTIHLAEYAVRKLSRGTTTKAQPLMAPTRRRIRSRRALIGATALLCALAAGYALRAAGPEPPVAQAQDATAAAPCSITFVIISTLERQFDAVLTVTNTTDEPIPQWVVAFNELGGLSISDTRAGLAVDNPRQVAAGSPVVHVSQQGQTVTITSTSTLDAGASLTQTLKAQYASQPGGNPGAFTLNGKRCDTTVILDAAAIPQTTATAAASPVVEASPRG
ncbi:MAG TPA: serine/threonine-protein kinase [Candidatus Limnocylindrales bacterium]|nr:serine/threonine-protein kinase [Candidatus Limnocylindrales bacterium]